jgi:hypothetical protein
VRLVQRLGPDAGAVLQRDQPIAVGLGVGRRTRQQGVGGRDRALGLAAIEPRRGQQQAGVSRRIGLR